MSMKLSAVARFLAKCSTNCSTKQSSTCLTSSAFQWKLAANGKFVCLLLMKDSADASHPISSSNVGWLAGNATWKKTCAVCTTVHHSACWDAYLFRKKTSSESFENFGVVNCELLAMPRMVFFVSKSHGFCINDGSHESSICQKSRPISRKQKSLFREIAFIVLCLPDSTWWFTPIFTLRACDEGWVSMILKQHQTACHRSLLR